MNSGMAAALRAIAILSIFCHADALSTLPRNVHSNNLILMQVRMEKNQNSTGEHSPLPVRDRRGEKGAMDMATSTEILPGGSLVMQHSQGLFSEVGAHVAAFQKRLIQLQNQGAEEIANLKIEYEAKLKAQREEILAAQASNSRVTAAIEDVRKKNKVLRDKASELANASKAMRREIEHMQDEMALATEYSQETLTLSEKLLNSSEMQVLADLTEEEARLERRLKHEKRLQSVSMLQLQSEPKLSTQDLIRDMEMSLDDAAKATAASETALKQEFEKKFQIGEQDLKTVRDLHEKLGTTFAEETKLQQKLVAALQHLAKVHNHLVVRHSSIRKFVANNVLNRA